MNTNAIKNLKTEIMRDPSNQAVPILIMGLNLYDLEHANAFMKEVVEKWLIQRMVSPPQTSVMLISVFTSMRLTDFRTLWRKHVEADGNAKFFFNQMKKADAITGTDDAAVMEQLSLLDDRESSVIVQR